MKVSKFETQEEWLEGRRGKITGSRLKDIVVKRGTGEKIGYYELIAERIAVQSDGENAMDRGHRLEEEAIEVFSKKTGLTIDTSLVIWERDDNRSIAISPDGFSGNNIAVEVKCLSSARHIEAKLTGEYPKEYHEQIVQYFIVNDDLEILYFIMYDPRMPENLKLLTFEITRGQVEEEITSLKKYQEDKLTEINRIVAELTF